MSKRVGVIFDFNGTLFYDSPKHVLTFKSLCSDFGLKEYSEEYIVKNIFGKNNRTIMLESYDPNANEEEIKNFDRIKEEIYRRHCLEDKESLHLAKGAPEFLDHLKENGIPYSIATGSPTCNLEFYFEHLGLGRWFGYDNITYDDGTFPCKPAPDIYYNAASKMGIDPSECIVFEDATSGIISANAAGIGSVYAVVRKGLPSPLTSETKVCGVIEDFTKYKEIIKKYL